MTDDMRMAAAAVIDAHHQLLNLKLTARSRSILPFWTEAGLLLRYIVYAWVAVFRAAAVKRKPAFSETGVEADE